MGIRNGMGRNGMGAGTVVHITLFRWYLIQPPYKISLLLSGIRSDPIELSGLIILINY